MKTILLITLSLLLSRFSTNAQWVNLRYGVGDYCADSSHADITCFHADSLRLDVQYYKDFWEEEKRKNYVLVNGRAAIRLRKVPVRVQENQLQSRPGFLRIPLPSTLHFYLKYRRGSIPWEI